MPENDDEQAKTPDAVQNDFTWSQWLFVKGLLLGSEAPLEGEPERLGYHYTDASGLVGILTSRTLWATHYAYLNDSTECSLLKPLYVSALQRHSALLAKGFDLPRLADAITHLEHAPFVTCFSAVPDSLFQWRCYGGNGAGFSIGFSLDALMAAPSPMLRRSRAQLEYDSDAHSKFVDEVFDEVLANTTLTPESTPEEIGRALAVIASTYSAAAPRCKHWSFVDERESRIILSRAPSDSDEPVVKVRATRGHLVPYTELPIRYSLSDGSERHAIREIWIGPCQHPEMAERSVRLLLKQHRYPDDITIKQSDKPWRPL